jgi:hypothetical protein
MTGAQDLKFHRSLPVRFVDSAAAKILGAVQKGVAAHGPFPGWLKDIQNQRALRTADGRQVIDQAGLAGF